MNFLRQNWLAFLVVIAVIGSYFIAREDNTARLHKSRASLVSGCVRTSPRAAITAAWAFDAARVRRASGEKAAADRYDAYGNGLVLTLPAPDGHVGDPGLAEVTEVLRGGRKVYVLTDVARALEREGCEQAYPAP